MTAATKDRALVTQIGDLLAHPVKGGVQIFLGTLVNKDANGYAVPATDTPGETSLGVAHEQIDNRLGADGEKFVRCIRNDVVQMAIAAVAISDVNKSVYVVDDQTVAFSGNVKCGTIGKVDPLLTTTAFVDLDSGVALATTPHAPSHSVGGGDDLALTNPVTIGTANVQGAGPGYAAGDHVHDHGAQTEPTHHAVATGALNGFMSSGDKTTLDALDALGLAAHASRHQTGGADPIPLATTILDGLMDQLDKAFIDAMRLARGNIIHVSTAGSDINGAVKDPSKPYATVAAAIAEAVLQTGKWLVFVDYGDYAIPVDTGITNADGVMVLGADMDGVKLQFDAATADVDLVMAENMAFGNLTIEADAASGFDFSVVWPGTSHMTSRLHDVRMLGTGLGDTFGCELTGAGLASRSHYFMTNVWADLVSETNARGVLSNSAETEATLHAYMKDCHFNVVGVGGAGIEVFGLIGAPGCTFKGTAFDVINVAPEADNILEFDGATSFDEVSPGGGFLAMNFLGYPLTVGVVYVDGTAKAGLGTENDPSRPFQTIADGIARAVFAGSKVVSCAPQAYAEAVAVPAGILLYAPGCTFTSLAVSDGAMAIVDWDIVVPYAAGPITLVAEDHGKIVTNEGAGALVVVNLPAAVPGLRFRGFVYNANGLQLDADGTDTIRDLATVSAAGGNIASVTVGDSVELVCITAGEWFTSPATGTWVVT